jgi:hypothetical protein
MWDKTSFAEKLKTLGKLVVLGGEDPIMDQTITNGATAGPPAR